MFHKILVAIDGSDSSHDVFKTALDIAKADQANLVLLHVLSFEEQNNLTLPMPIGMDYMPVADSETVRIYQERWQTYEQQNLDLLKSLAERATAAGVTTEFRQIAGGPGRNRSGRAGVRRSAAVAGLCGLWPDSPWSCHS